MNHCYEKMRQRSRSRNAQVIAHQKREPVRKKLGVGACATGRPSRSRRRGSARAEPKLPDRAKASPHKGKRNNTPSHVRHGALSQPQRCLAFFGRPQRNQADRACQRRSGAATIHDQFMLDHVHRKRLLAEFVQR